MESEVQGLEAGLFPGRGDAAITDADVTRRLAAIAERHPEIVVIVSPPRCSSTAFARVFWEHPQVRYYCHEPFEVTYYDDAPLADVAAKLEAPLDLAAHYKSDVAGEALVIKEMPYQVGARIDALLDLATRPVIFLMRDPRLNIASRIRKKVEGGERPQYPFIESGWRLLEAQLARAAERGVDHVLVDAGDFRARPHAVFAAVFARLGLTFDPAMLVWRPCAELRLDNLDGRHDHLYRRVLSSTGIQPTTAAIPPLESFAEDGGLRAHVARCLEIYRGLRRAPARLVAAD